MTEYLLAAAAVVGLLIGSIAMHIYDKAGMAALEATYAKYQEQVAQVQANEARAAAQALMAQQAASEAISKENASVIQDLNAKLASADSLRASDRATVSRLLHSQGASCPAGGQLPQGAGKPNPAGPDSADQVAGACSDLAAEDAMNADKVDSLNRELTNQ